MSQTWDDDFDERLVDCVRTFPVLWEMKRNSYKDKVAKDNAWKNISEILRHSEEDCKKRWRNIRDAYKRNKKRTITGSAATKSKYTDNDHLKFLDASLAERESHCSIEENEEEESTQQSNRTEENEAGSSSSVQHIGASKEVMVDNEILSDVLSKESDNEASNDKILKSKHTYDECTTSKESTINQLEEVALNENLNGKNKRRKTHLAPDKTQIWNQFQKNQTERFEVIKSLLQNSNDNKNVENERHPIYKFFESLAETVVQFPPDLIAETRATVAQVVTDFELKKIARLSQPIMPLERQLPPSTVLTPDNMLRSNSALSLSEYSSYSAITSPHNPTINSPEYSSASVTTCENSREHSYEESENIDGIIQAAYQVIN